MVVIASASVEREVIFMPERTLVLLVILFINHA
jgi:hypothetical protein